MRLKYTINRYSNISISICDNTVTHTTAMQCIQYDTINVKYSDVMAGKYDNTSDKNFNKHLSKIRMFLASRH